MLHDNKADVKERRMIFKINLIYINCKYRRLNERTFTWM